MKKVFWIVILCLFCAATLAEEEDPVVVRVGLYTYTKSQLQTAIDTNIEFNEFMESQEMTDEARKARRDEIIGSFVATGVLKSKLHEAGRDTFTPEEEENLKASARTLYDQLWQSFWERAQQSDGDFTQAQVTEYLEESGYSVEAIYEEYRVSELRYRAIDLYCPDITLTEDMVREYYESQFLNPDRERYENNIGLYEQEILAGQNESFYTPSGYRAIQQVLIEYPDKVLKGLTREKMQFSFAAQKVAAALEPLSRAALTAQSWEDIAEACKGYSEAMDALNAVQKEIVQKREALAMPLVQNKIDEIRNAFEAGTDFAVLIDRYSDDTNEQNTQKGGYPIHPDSPNWPAEFLQAASALEKPGEISEPVLTDLGVHILYYASDIPEGAHVLTEEEHRTLEESALNYYQNQALDSMIDGWRQDCDIETHPELLDN